MAYRYTNTDKWSDAWFTALKPLEKLLFNYICDNCDIAGFIEFTPKKWAFEIGAKEAIILGALKGLSRGLIYSQSNDCLYVRNFLKHQKNLPLRESNNAHKGIIRRFEIYADKFSIESIDDFISINSRAPKKGLSSPYGNGNGNGSISISNNEEEKEQNWRTDYKIYMSEAANAFKEISEDKDFLSKQMLYYPNVNILKSMYKLWTEYWGTEEGWQKKKSSKTVNIDWRKTISKTIGFNKVYYTKQEQLDYDNN